MYLKIKALSVWNQIPNSKILGVPREAKSTPRDSRVVETQPCHMGEHLVAKPLLQWLMGLYSNGYGFCAPEENNRC
jgi:hypothetical protein